MYCRPFDTIVSLILFQSSIQSTSHFRNYHRWLPVVVVYSLKALAVILMYPSRGAAILKHPQVDPVH